MAYFDLPRDALETYLPDVAEPVDFDAFWETTLSEARRHDVNVTLEPAEDLLKLIEVFDLTFSGYAGQRVKAWLVLPRARSGPLPCVVEYQGYGGGRGVATERLGYAAAGYAHLVMDTRGQGGGWSSGDTPDLPDVGSSPHHPGSMTVGILKPETYYYRRLMTDAVRAVDAAKALEVVDETKIAVAGISQGGGLTLAVAGLVPELAAALPDVPFLCHFERATTLVDTTPYFEIVRFLRVQRDQAETVYRTLSYFDGVNFAKRAAAPALFSAGLMDDVCPPSTVYAAYNHYQGQKDIRVYPFNTHEGGGLLQAEERYRFLAKRFG